MQPGARVIRAYGSTRGGTPEATVAGQAQQLPAADAAWCNGGFMHCLDYEVQGYPSAHGTSSILPAALALGEKYGGSGRDLLVAFARGWDVQQRLRVGGASAPKLRIFHRGRGSFGGGVRFKALAEELGLSVAHDPQLG